MRARSDGKGNSLRATLLMGSFPPRGVPVPYY